MGLFDIMDFIKSRRSMEIKKDYTKAIVWVLIVSIAYTIWSTIFKIIL